MLPVKNVFNVGCDAISQLSAKVVRIQKEFRATSQTAY